MKRGRSKTGKANVPDKLAVDLEEEQGTRNLYKSMIGGRQITEVGDLPVGNNGQSVLVQDERLPSIDHEEVAYDRKFLSLLEPDEKVVYSTPIIKINKRGSRQQRVLVFTNRHMYNLRPKSFGTAFLTFFNRNAKVKKMLLLIYVEIIIYSETGDEFVVSAPKDYDFHYSSTKRNEVIDYLFFARKLANCGNVLQLAMQPLDFLRTYTLHPSEKACGKQRVLGTGVLPISHDEFEVNFCGKKMISENLMPTGNNVTLQDFEFLSMLGVGGFSKVYLSKMKKTNELFAIKSIRLPEKKDNISHKMQIQHERDILVQISHPNIVKLKYAFQSRKRFFLVMPFVQGGELLNYIKREGNRVDENLVRFYGAQIALALQYLHSLGIVYGDLKPENILVDKYGYIKLTDFGASKMLNGKNSTLGFAGTADYLAPEVLKEKKITKASDWWTFGILLYKMLFGQTPFYHDNSNMMFKGILNGTPIFPKKLKVSEEIKDLISQLLRKKSERRLGSKTDSEIFNHPWFKKIDFDSIRTKKLLAPILPNIEDESSLENFSKMITTGQLKLSFEQTEVGRKSKREELDSSGQLIDFDFAAEDYVETALVDSFGKGSPVGTQKKNLSNLDQLERIMREEKHGDDISEVSEEEEEYSLNEEVERFDAYKRRNPNERLHSLELPDNGDGSLE